MNADTRRLPAALTLLTILAAGTAQASSCELPGAPVQWLADLCLFEIGSDDLIAASPCIEAKRQQRFADDCAAKRHFKAELCRALVARGDSAYASAEQCLRDPDFAGPIVANDGSGG